MAGPGEGWAVPAWAQPALLQVNRFRKSRDRALLLTDRHLYKLEPGRQYRVMRAVPLDAVSTVDILHHLESVCEEPAWAGSLTSPSPSPLFTSDGQSRSSSASGGQHSSENLHSGFLSQGPRLPHLILSCSSQAKWPLSAFAVLGDLLPVKI